VAFSELNKKAEKHPSAQGRMGVFSYTCPQTSPTLGGLVLKTNNSLQPEVRYVVAVGVNGNVLKMLKLAIKKHLPAKYPDLVFVSYRTFSEAEAEVHEGQDNILLLSYIDPNANLDQIPNLIGQHKISKTLILDTSKKAHQDTRLDALLGGPESYRILTIPFARLTVFILTFSWALEQ
jgi:hypothetical protein